MSTSYTIKMNLRFCFRNIISLEDFTFVIILMQRMSLVSSDYNIHNIENSKVQKAECKMETNDDIVEAICGLSIDKENIYSIPDDLPTNVHVLDLRPSQGAQETTFYLKQDELARLTELNTILLQKNYIMHWGSKHKNARLPHPDHDVYKKLFNGLPTLEELHFIESCLGDAFQFTLPTSIKRITLDSNEYTFLDLQHATELEELSLNNNKLKNIPSFSNPPPPLHTLQLKRNPLAEMTLVDLAQLCFLKALELEFPDHTRYNEPHSDMSFCECDTMITWLKNQSITGIEHVQCTKPYFYGSFDCVGKTSKILEEANKFRDKCADLKRDIGLKESSGMVLLIVYAILVLMLIAAVIAFIIWTRRPHPPDDESLPPSSPAVVEAHEEEEIFADAFVDETVVVGINVGMEMKKRAING